MQDHYAGTHRFDSIVNLNVTFEMNSVSLAAVELHPVDHQVPICALARVTLFAPNTCKSWYDVGDQAKHNEELG